MDGVRAAARERPRTAEELAARLKDAAAAGHAVIPVGGGRALGLGDPPERFDLALETAGLDRIIEHSHADLVVTVEAGVTLERLNEELGRSGQLLPLDPIGGPGHTVGGVLAAALSGPLRLGYGSARDFLIGLRVALPDGTLASSGGRVVKNVSGYDMGKLHHGGLGSLGVIVAASFKLFPRPLHEATVAVEPGSFEEAWEEAGRALALPARPVALVLQRSAEGFSLRARLTGTRDAVARLVRELGWPEAEPDWAAPVSVPAEPWARLSVPPLRLREAVAALPDGSSWLALPGVGVAHWFGAGGAEAIRAARAGAEAGGGSLVLMAAPPELKRELGAWGTPPPAVEVMRGLKRAFDPGRVLSPGRFLI